MRQIRDNCACPARVAFALRELQQHVRHPTTATILCAVALVLMIIDAFGLRDLMTLAPHLIYMLVMVWVTYAIGFLVAQTFGTWLSNTRLSGLVGWLVQGAVAGVFILAAVLGLNLLAFGSGPPNNMASFALSVIGATMVITVTLQHLHQLGSQPIQTPAILDRLPFAKRGSLLSLSAEDHYTSVRTDKGEELILMRFSDAMKEAAPIEGYQIHRSHWVARSGIKDVRRSKDRAIVTLTDGTEIPLSRRYVPKLQKAGLLPAPRA
ncbi:LytTR family DNA-binding domain-containing protein [Ruegeria sp. 2205SS24-7]|uniref:LytTR family DNA-binding domain-containing protein n=1 Tax=Ruegeria discodermiae TaxID=3064389 RepID=UPI002740D32B|nr:LytTR family DNA-binding domain-containing protein [Ruegeria sp. 2205SS24-7]MDP5217692.1 LytTR family DNA-binding domain-containing protein [Ruegeria sp. 2205SS24-7]